MYQKPFYITASVCDPACTSRHKEEYGREPKQEVDTFYGIDLLLLRYASFLFLGCLPISTGLFSSLRSTRQGRIALLFVPKTVLFIVNILFPYGSSFLLRQKAVIEQFPHCLECVGGREVCFREILWFGFPGKEDTGVHSACNPAGDICIEAISHD